MQMNGNSQCARAKYSAPTRVDTRFAQLDHAWKTVAANLQRLATPYQTVLINPLATRTAEVGQYRQALQVTAQRMPDAQ